MSNLVLSLFFFLLLLPAHYTVTFNYLSYTATVEDAKITDYILPNEERVLVTPSPIMTFLGQFVSKGETVYSMLPGLGFSFMSLASMVGPNGRVVAVEPRLELFDQLKEIVVSNDLWERSLLVRAELSAIRMSGLKRSSDENGSLENVDEDTPTMCLTVSELFELTSSVCPKLLVIAADIAISQDYAQNITYADQLVVDTLYGADMMLRTCQPIVSVQVGNSVIASRVVHYLSMYKYYNLYISNAELTINFSSIDSSIDIGGNSSVLTAIPSTVSISASEVAHAGMKLMKEVEVASTDASLENTLSINLADILSIDSRLIRSGLVPDYDDRNQGWSLSSDRSGEEFEELNYYLKEWELLKRWIEEPQRHMLLVPLELLALSIMKDLYSLNHFPDIGDVFTASANDLDSYTMTDRYTHRQIEYSAEAYCFRWLNGIYEDIITWSFRKELDTEGSVCAGATKGLQVLCETQTDVFVDEQKTATLTCSSFLAAQLSLLYYAKNSHGKQIESGDSDYEDGELRYRNYDVKESFKNGRDLGWFKRRPLQMLMEMDSCGEPIWCSHTQQMQKLIHRWQFPAIGHGSSPSSSDNQSLHQLNSRTCGNSKFLVYEPPTAKLGIGAFLESMAIAFRLAICLDRILLLHNIELDTMLKWRIPGCREGDSTMGCYFLPISSCSVTEEELSLAPASGTGLGFDSYPLRNERVLGLSGIPSVGKCSVCYSAWEGAQNSKFFDGFFFGQPTRGTLKDDENMDLESRGYDKHIIHMASFMGTVKQTWAAQFLRFLLRPRVWFSNLVDQLVAQSMYSPYKRLDADEMSSSDSQKNASERLLVASSDFPRTFASLHVRYGMKAAEVALQPLSKYMVFIQKKLPHIKDIFLSTESEHVIDALVRAYPQFNFHFLNYQRIEYLPLDLKNETLSASIDYFREFAYSFANLRVAVEADGFVGTLSSNWCMMIMHLERTRGDGGLDYYSMDTGSAFTSCF